MSAVEKQRIAYRRCVRLWYRCTDCRMYGCYTAQDDAHADEILADYAAAHDCQRVAS